MEETGGLAGETEPNPPRAGERPGYNEQITAIRAAFASHERHRHAGAAAVEARSAAVDELVRKAWDEVAGVEPLKGIALIAVGGYGRQELFPFSDVDLMFLLDARVAERTVQEPIRNMNQRLWDAGLRVSAMTRTLEECGRFNAENVEFTLSLMDARALAGDAEVSGRLLMKTMPKLLGREGKRIQSRLRDTTRGRHRRFGGTLFHLEPNVKECPGGLRDAHGCEWMARLGAASGQASRQGELVMEPAFREAREFLLLVRTFLHFRHGRDDNTLDWQAQDAAAAASLGISRAGRASERAASADGSVDAAYWMRLYFRHARAVERCASQFLAPDRGPSLEASRTGRMTPEEKAERTNAGFEVHLGRIWFQAEAHEPEHEPEIVLSVFAAMAESGATLSREAEQRIEEALPLLSANLEDGPRLWLRLKAILLGGFAGAALRSMHALGILELVIPEFHGIDALVIRDAYHRYTVDEHTFVLIDTLHGLNRKDGARAADAEAGLKPWAAKFAQLFRDLPHPELLLLASLLHDTGKGYAGEGHAIESVRMAGNVLARLELYGYEAGLVLGLIADHLEMSAALRRDVFDPETIRSFAVRVPNPEALRMLTLFTFADIAAVHPDALTPWKAENLWRLYTATATYLDRSVDEARVAAETSDQLSDVVLRVQALLPKDKVRVNEYLEGFPERYLQTRTPELVRTHMEMAWRLGEPGAIELDFRYAPGVSELTLVTNDRPALFASMAGALAGWGMNIVTADAFSNAQGVVVDSFRFTDTFRTLELNESERGRFVASVKGVIAGTADVETLLSSRRRGRRKAVKVQVESRIDFDHGASSHSTLIQVAAQDTPGLLRAVALTLAEHGCNIEVALVDTEGEMAIDVFYVTRAGRRLVIEEQGLLRQALLRAIDENAR